MQVALARPGSANRARARAGHAGFRGPAWLDLDFGLGLCWGAGCRLRTGQESQRVRLSFREFLLISGCLAGQAGQPAAERMAAGLAGCGHVQVRQSSTTTMTSKAQPRLKLFSMC